MSAREELVKSVEEARDTRTAIVIFMLVLLLGMLCISLGMI